MWNHARFGIRVPNFRMALLSPSSWWKKAHEVKSRKAIISIFTAVTTSNLTHGYITVSVNRKILLKSSTSGSRAVLRLPHISIDVRSKFPYKEHEPHIFTSGTTSKYSPAKIMYIEPNNCLYYVYLIEVNNTKYFRKYGWTHSCTAYPVIIINFTLHPFVGLGLFWKISPVVPFLYLYGRHAVVYLFKKYLSLGQTTQLLLNKT